MTSMFDQYERVSLKKSSVSKADKSRMDFYDPSPLESETPIFSKSKMEFSPPKQVTHVCICNKYMVVAMVNRMLFRMNLSHPQQKDEITIPKTVNGKLTNIFLDPPGNHLLAAFGNELNPELLYLSRRGTKLKVTSKFKSYEITEVAWNPDYESEATTGQILLGTSKGSIVETEIISESEQNVRKVFDIGKGTSSPITGMYFFKNHNKYFIFVAIPNRLYYFTGLARTDEKSLFQQIFNCYLNIPEPDTYIEVESKLPYSKLQFWSENLTQPNSFAWMTEEGITFGEINSTNEDNIAALKCGLKQVKYPSSTNSPANFFVLTQFHALLGYPDSIKAICLLNNEIVYEDNYNEAFGKLISVIKDPMTGDVWAVTENALFHFKVKREDRNVWYIYYESGELELAKKYAGNNEYHRNQILTKEADLLFEKKEYEQSALRYAETQSSFEEICLKFIDANQVEALKVFLQNKLQKLQPQDKTQITMIVLWIVELYLNKLEGMRLRGLEKTASYADVQKDFESFLCQRSVSDCVGKNRQTVFNLMASHGDKYNLMKFTIINKDFEMLIKQHIYKNNFLEALEVLKGQSNRELFYQFSPILMQKVPKYTIKVLIEQESYLKPVKLLPALVCCDDEEHSMEVIKYLEFCINRLKTTEKAIHNLLISLYAKYDPEKLMKYLDAQGRQLLLVNYDVYFALRLCREKKLTEACVKLSSLLGLWESAVDLALEISVDLAKQIANMPPQNDIEMRKKLWLKIAQRVVSGKDDIQEAMGFLKECDLIRIEDVLPFFSDFVTIDHFKEAICDSLKEYNQHIQDLKEDMEEATRSAELVREEIQSFRNRFTYLTTLDCCDICSFTLMVRGFYVFPCKHRFHTDCLLKELLPLLGSAKRNKLEDLERQLKVMNDQNHVDNVSTGSSGISARDILKTQIDNIIAAECLYCGENMIRNIDKPFIDENDYEKILKEWE